MRRSRLSIAGAIALGSFSSAAHGEELLRGPHPFLKENTLEIAGGAALADAYAGTRMAMTYDYQAAGSLWLELRLDFWRTGSGPFAKDPSCAAPPCARLDSMVDVMVGAQYRLRTSLPVVPYARAAMGPAFLFPTGVDRAFGLAARVGAGAKWYAYDWLGFGAELGAVAATTGLDERGAFNAATGLDAGFALLELLAAVEVQF